MSRCKGSDISSASSAPALNIGRIGEVSGTLTVIIKNQTQIHYINRDIINTHIINLEKNRWKLMSQNDEKNG